MTRPWPGWLLLLIGLSMLTSHAAASAELYQDAQWGYRLEVPADWSTKVVLVNEGKPPYVIKQKTFFTGPGGPAIVLDLWTNDDGLSLEQWFEKHRKLLIPEQAEVPAGPNGLIGDRPIIRIRNPQQQACDQLLTFFARGGLIFRLEYRITDGLAAEPIYQQMLSSFRLEGNDDER